MIPHGCVQLVERVGGAAFRALGVFQSGHVVAAVGTGDGVDAEEFESLDTFGFGFPPDDGGCGNPNDGP